MDGISLINPGHRFRVLDEGIPHKQVYNIVSWLTKSGSPDMSYKKGFRIDKRKYRRIRVTSLPLYACAGCLDTSAGL